MNILSRKSEVACELQKCMQGNTTNPEKLVRELHQRLLNSKIKFPLLEYCAEEIYDQTPKDQHFKICDEISALKTIGGDVIIGILLRNHLSQNTGIIFEKAANYIAHSGTWQATDIIGERVFGPALLLHFESALNNLKTLSSHPNNWVVRSIGPGCHNAVKNGLSADKVKALFELLISLSGAKDYHIKTGIGWAAKTVAKFHPDIIIKYDLENEHVGQWFRTKVRIGLERNSYAKRN